MQFKLSLFTVLIGAVVLASAVPTANPEPEACVCKEDVKTGVWWCGNLICG